MTRHVFIVTLLVACTTNDPAVQSGADLSKPGEDVAPPAPGTERLAFELSATSSGNAGPRMPVRVRVDVPEAFGVEVDRGAASLGTCEAMTRLFVPNTGKEESFPVQRVYLRAQTCASEPRPCLEQMASSAIQDHVAKLEWVTPTRASFVISADLGQIVRVAGTVVYDRETNTVGRCSYDPDRAPKGSVEAYDALCRSLAFGDGPTSVAERRAARPPDEAVGADVPARARDVVVAYVDAVRRGDQAAAKGLLIRPNDCDTLFQGPGRTRCRAKATVGVSLPAGFEADRVRFIESEGLDKTGLRALVVAKKGGACELETVLFVAWVDGAFRVVPALQ